MGIIDGAFGGKFTAQVKVALLEAPVVEATLQWRVPPGLKSPEVWQTHVTFLQENGCIATADVQMPWTAHLVKGKQTYARKESATKVKQESLRCRNWEAVSRRAQVKRELEDGSAVSFGLAQPVPAPMSPPAYKSRRKRRKEALPPTPNMGYACLCNSATQQECLSLGLFGSPENHLDLMSCIIEPGMRLFLFNYETSMLMGTFAAAGRAAHSIVPDAFDGRFPAQVLAVPLGGGATHELHVPFSMPQGVLEEEDADAFAQMLESQGTRMVRLLTPRTATTSKRRGLAVKAELSECVEPKVSSASSSSTAMRPTVPLALHRGSTSALTKHLNDDGESTAGFVFFCDAISQYECEVLELFGAPADDLERMERCITDSTVILLFNVDTCTVLGQFAAVGRPALNIMPSAFCGSCPAQLRVASLKLPIREAKLDRYLEVGPLSSFELAENLEQMEQGEETKFSLSKSSLILVFPSSQWMVSR